LAQDQPENEPDKADTQLRCPFCSYNLTALTSARCPECGNAFAIVRPGDILRPEPAGFLGTSSMSCPKCGYVNKGFMPRLCSRCGYEFSLWQRIFGVKGRIG